MKKITFLLMGLLLFACNSATTVSAPVEAEDEWVYGVYVPSLFYIVNDDFDEFTETYIRPMDWALIYMSEGKRYFQQQSSFRIPPIEFKGNRAEYKDSVVNLIIEKNSDKFLVEITAPEYLHISYWSDYSSNRNRIDQKKLHTLRYLLHEIPYDR